MTQSQSQFPQVDYSKTPEGLAEHVLEYRGCPIHYWKGGAQGRPALVFLHGGLMDHRMFNAQIDEFAQDYGVIAWDGRGHGKSQPFGPANYSMEDYAVDLVAVLEHAGIQKAVLVGQSMGAYIGQHFTRLHPDRVNALVVIGSTPIAFPVANIEIASLRFFTGAFRLWPMENFRKMSARNTSIKEDVQHYALEAMRQIDRETLVRI
jgi:3-oxoadipate enol-lactonase